MDEHPESALHYGHVGRAVYLPEEQVWTFNRSFVRREESSNSNFRTS